MEEQNCCDEYSIFHYTGLEEIRSILREGVIRAQPMILWQSLFHFNDPSEIRRRTPPIVWFTINDDVEMTIWPKFVAPGHSPFGKLFRIAVPHGYGGDLGLGEYTDAVGIPHEDWRWVVTTGEMMGSHYTCWRIVPHDVSREHWLCVEVLMASLDDKLMWEPIDFSGTSIPDAVMRAIDCSIVRPRNTKRLRESKRLKKARRRKMQRASRRRRR